MRFFVAVYPSPEAVADLLPVAERLGVSGVERAELWHVTVAFPGEVSDARVPALTEAVAVAAAAARPGRLAVAGGDSFGGQVLWAGLRGDVDALVELSARIRQEFDRLGIGFDSRAYRPHLTLALPNGQVDAATLVADLAMLATYAGPSWPMAEVHLVRSHGGPGVRYETEQTWPLRGSSFRRAGRT